MSRADGAAALIGRIVERELRASVQGVARAAGGDINEAYRVDTDDGLLFVKTRVVAAPGTFADEAAGLLWLGEAGGPPVPAVALVHDPPAPDAGDDDLDPDDEDGVRFLALRWVEHGGRTPEGDEELGRGLARVHGAGAPAFGATPALVAGAPGGRAPALAAATGHAPLRMGEVELSNAPCDTFAEFWTQRRILPLAEEAHRRHAFSTEALALMHHLAERVPELAGPPEPPARTHGDLWAGNVLWDGAGTPHLIDPVAHGGHREVDLATLRVFGGPGPRCFAAYEEVAPLADGHEERVALWQLGIVLLHVVLFGDGYARQATDLAKQYL